MRIEKIEYGYIHIPLVTPFKTALREVSAVEDLIVRITADDGTVGYGEAPPTAVITGDTRESIEAAVRFYLAPALVGRELDDGDEIFDVLHRAMAKNTSPKAALDIALYDLISRAKGMPLYRMLAGKGKEKLVRSRIRTDLTISVNDTQTMVCDSLRAVSEGFDILKVKVGKGGKKDVERIREIRRAVGSDVSIRVDANQGWSVEEAIGTIRAMEEENLNIDLVEQPVNAYDFEGLKYITAHTDTPILADESVFSLADARRIITEHAADLINIKLMKTGGIHEAMKICDLAQDAGISCMIGCMLESKAAVSAAAHLAGARSCITMADLDGPSLCAEDPYTGGPVYTGPQILLTEDPGIGITKVPVEFKAV